MEPSATSCTVKTRFIILSDTHNKKPFDSSNLERPYRSPLPDADVLIHAGDLTVSGKQHEHQAQVEMLTEHSAEVKVVIPGNHDITLDQSYYASHRWKHRVPEDPVAIKQMYTGPEARKAGIFLMEEGVQSFELKNGAKFTVYASAYQPEFCDWAFAYARDDDRFNPPSLVRRLTRTGPANPVPSHPEIDIMVTHGPPFGVLDEVVGFGDWRKASVGCKHLIRAVQRSKPRLHAFGHIHEGWGARRMKWAPPGREDVEDELTLIEVNGKDVLETRGAYLDMSSDGGSGLQFGQETLFVNASIMDVRYNPHNAPWIIDLDLATSRTTQDMDCNEISQSQKAPPR